MLVTFATGWYALKSKFPIETYLEWMTYLFQSVQNYYLVIFTDAEGEKTLKTHFPSHPLIKIVIKPCEEWFNYRYKSQWINNHEKNTLLNDKTEWTLNMLWAEKISFVNDTRLNHYFPPTDFYGWCDIGYFREGPERNFIAPLKIKDLKKDKIYYARVTELDNFRQIVLNKNEVGLPRIPIPPHIPCISGGFFIAYQDKIPEWHNFFDTKLQLYFQHNYLVKDDQIIINDCVLSEPDRFEIISEPENNGQNHWFQFRRFLS